MFKLVLGAILFAAALWHYVVEASSDHLVTIRHVGRSPTETSGAWEPRVFHHSTLVSAYEDLSPQPWQFWIQYSGCAPTPRGALQLTVYQTFMGERTVTYQQAVHRMRLYSRVLVEHAASGSFTYQFPGIPETDFFIRVIVPSKAGCRSWRFGTLGN